MRESLVILATLLSTNAWANTQAIEPVLVPVKDATQNINIQMGKYEVTVAEFSRFAKATNYQVKDQCHLYNETHLPRNKHGSWDNPALTTDPYRPVVCLGAKDAIAYASWLSKETGKPYRLAEYDEWLYAAMAGRDSRFAYGEDYNYSEVCDYENVEDAANNAGLKQHHNFRFTNSANCNDGAIYHTVVGMYRPNHLGLHDMMGNVREILQTCGLYSKEDANVCQMHNLAGGAWHWLPDNKKIKDVMVFNGSIEGFRLVLDSEQVSPISKATQAFITGLSKAQQKASTEHKRLKSLPQRPQALRANLTGKQQVNLSWASSEDTKLTYSIYRSYFDPTGKESRALVKVAEGVQGNSYQDKLANTGFASYQVFANNAVGESQASKEVEVGIPAYHKLGQTIQAESYHQHRNSEVYLAGEQENVSFWSSDRHHPPQLMPYIPTWLTYQFNSERAGVGKLTMHVRAVKGARLEFWQGKHLIAEVDFEGTKDFEEVTVPTQLIVSNEPLQVREASKQFIALDWFKFH